jgi:hypothetical protein
MGAAAPTTMNMDPPMAIRMHTAMVLTTFRHILREGSSNIAVAPFDLGQS